MKITIAKLWREFSDQVLKGMPSDSIQYQEMRKAFYAGVVRSLIMLRDEVGQMPEEKGIEALEAMIQEAELFINAPTVTRYQEQENTIFIVRAKNPNPPDER